MSTLASERRKEVKKNDSHEVMQIDELLSHVDNDVIRWAKEFSLGQEFTMHRIKEILKYILSHEEILAYVEGRMSRDKNWKSSLKDLSELNKINDDESAEEGELMNPNGKEEELNSYREEGELVLTPKKHSLIQKKTKPPRTISPKRAAHSEKYNEQNSYSSSASSHLDRSSYKRTSQYSIPRYAHRPRNEPLSTIKRKVYERYRNRNFYSPRKVYCPKYSPSKILSDRISKYEKVNRKVLEEKGRKRSPRKNDYSERINPTHLSHGERNSKRTISEHRDSSSCERQRNSKKIRSSEKSPKNKPLIKVKISSNRKSKDLTRDDVMVTKDGSPNHESHQVQNEQSRNALSESQTEKAHVCKATTSQHSLPKIVPRDPTYESNDKISSSECIASSEIVRIIHTIPAESKDSVMARASNGKEKSQSRSLHFLAVEKQQKGEKNPASYMETVEGMEKKQTSDIDESLMTKKSRRPRKSLPTFRFVKSTSGTDSVLTGSIVKKPPPPSSSSDVDETVVPKGSTTPKKSLPTFRFVKTTSTPSETTGITSLPLETIEIDSAFTESVSSTEKKQYLSSDDETAMTTKRARPRKSLHTFKCVKATTTTTPSLITEITSRHTGSTEKKQALSEDDEEIMIIKSPRKPTFRFVKSTSKLSETVRTNSMLIGASGTDFMFSASDGNMKEKQSSRITKSPTMKDKISPRKSLSTFLHTKTTQSSFLSSSTSESDEEQAASEDIVEIPIIKKRMISKKSLLTSNSVETAVTSSELKTIVENIEKNKISRDVAASPIVKKRMTPKNPLRSSMPLETIGTASMLMETVGSIENKCTSNAKSSLTKDGISHKNPSLISKPLETVATFTRAAKNTEERQASGVIENLMMQKLRTSEKSSPTSVFVESVENIKKKQILKGVESRMLEKRIIPEKSLSTSLPMETVETTMVTETVESTSKSKGTIGMKSTIMETVERAMNQQIPGPIKGSVIMERVISQNPLPIFTPIEIVGSITKQLSNVAKNSLIKERMVFEKSPPTSKSSETVKTNSMHTKTVERTEETSQNVTKNCMTKKKKTSEKLLSTSVYAGSSKRKQTLKEARSPIVKKKVTPKKSVLTSMPVDMVATPVRTETVGNTLKKRISGDTKCSMKKKMKLLNSPSFFSNPTGIIETTSTLTGTTSMLDKVVETTTKKQTLQNLNSSIMRKEIISKNSLPISIPIGAVVNTSILTEIVGSTSVPTETVETVSMFTETVRTPSIPTGMVGTPPTSIGNIGSTSTPSETVGSIMEKKLPRDVKRAIIKKPGNSKILANIRRLPLKKTSKMEAITDPAILKESKSSRNYGNGDKLKFHKRKDIKSSPVKLVYEKSVICPSKDDVSKSRIENISVGNDSTGSKNERKDINSSTEEKQGGDTSVQGENSVETCFSRGVVNINAKSIGAKACKLNSKIDTLQEKQLRISAESKNMNESSSQKIAENVIDVLDGNTEVSNDSSSTSNDSSSTSNDSSSTSNNNSLSGDSTEVSADSTSASDDSNGVLDDSTAVSHHNKSNSSDRKTKSPDDNSPPEDEQLKSTANAVVKSPGELPSTVSVVEHHRKPNDENKLNTATHVTTSLGKEEHKKKEDVEKWTREQDREILLMCKQIGTNQLAFKKAANTINRTMEQVEKRFYDLMEVFKKKLESQESTM